MATGADEPPPRADSSIARSRKRLARRPILKHHDHHRRRRHEFGAPAALLREVHEAALSEVHHAELTFALASHYLGAPVGPAALVEAAAFTGARDLAELAAATVREGCVGETLAAAVAAAQREPQSAGMRAHGRFTRAQGLAERRRAVDEVIVPAMTRLLGLPD